MDGLPHALVAAVLEELPLVVLFGISSTSQLWSSLINETVAFRTTLVGPADDLAALVEAAEPGATFRVRGTCLIRRLYITKPVRIVGENGSALVGGDGRSMITISVGGTVQVRDLELRYDAKEAPDFFVQRSIVNVIAGVLRLARCQLSWETSPPGQALGVAVRGGSVLEMDRCRIGGPIGQARSSIGPLLFCDRAGVTLSQCELKGAGYGGCAVLKGGTASISQTDIGVSEGNGVALWAAARATVSRCRLLSCKDHGIAVMTQRGTLVADANTFEDIGGEQVYHRSTNPFGPPPICSAASMMA